jgi:glutathione synthase/RimK-type ligase-like ATP-grasp enzyme
MAIIFTFGVSDQGTASVRPDADGRMNIHVDGNCDVLGMIDLGPVQAIPLLMYGPNAEQPLPDIPAKPSLVFNQISDADSHGTSLERCVELCQRLAGVPVVNHPEAVLQTGRDRVSELLQDVPGVRVPRTVRIQPRSPAEVIEAVEERGIGFPAIMRTVGDHNARSMVRMNGPGDADSLHPFRMDGRDFFLSEYIDTRNESGLYFKHRIAMIAGEPVVRHATFHEHWIVNSKCVPFMLEHKEFGNPVERGHEVQEQRIPKALPALREIAQRLGLDYFGMDCQVDEEGRVLVFEANANMNMLLDGVFGVQIQIQVEVLKQKLRQLLQDRSGEPVLSSSATPEGPPGRTAGIQ